MYYRSAILVAASSLLFCVNLTQGFMPAPPTVQSSKAVSAQVAEPLVAPVNAVMKGGQPVNSDKPKLKLPNTCDSDYECDGTEFCCDFMFFKMCCSDGKLHAHDGTCLPIAQYIADGSWQFGGDCSLYRRFCRLLCATTGWRAKEEWVPVPIPIPIPIDPYYGRGDYR